jgi:hypothetical protein
MMYHRGPRRDSSQLTGKKIMTRTRTIAALAATAALALTGCSGTANDTSGGTAPDQPTVKHHQTATGKPKANNTPDMTVSQENAISAAQDYLDTGSFSRSGLISQLSSKYGEGFPKADAVYAVNHIDVNWKQQAAAAAQDYLDTGSFSRTGLIQQLSSQYGDGFTHAQAVYGVNQVGL